MNIQNTQTMMLTLDAFIYIHLSNMNIHVVQQQKDQTVQNKTNKQKKKHCIYKRSVRHTCSTVCVNRDLSVQHSTLSARELYNITLQTPKPLNTAPYLPENRTTALYLL